MQVLSGKLMIPSIEDLAILKLMSGEKKDLSDLKKILHQAWHRLDREYLYRRASQAGLEKERPDWLRGLVYSEAGEDSS